MLHIGVCEGYSIAITNYHSLRVNTKITQPHGSTKQFSVTRSYKDFLLLHTKLIQTFTSSCTIVPSPPGRRGGGTVRTRLGVGKGGRSSRKLEGWDLLG